MAENFFDPKPTPKRKRKPKGEPAAMDWLPNTEWREDLAKSEGGKILRTLNNVMVALRQCGVWRGTFAWNQFSNRLMLMRAMPGTLMIEGQFPREVTDPDISNVTDWMQHNGILVGSQITAEAMRVVAEDCAYHPVREYLTGLTWDDKPRLDTWLMDHLGVVDTHLHRAFGARWMIGLVARVFEPGCQLDTALILESRQGFRKSTTLRTLAGRWFTDHVPDLSTKDALEQLQGVWIVEMAELTSFNKAEAQRIKSFLTTRVDRFRPSFGRVAVDHPRQCGFAGTINPGSNGYLRDETGARRFWIVSCGEGWDATSQVNITKLDAARDHLWAEAVHRYRANEIWWLDTAELDANQAQAADLRQTDDPREPKIREFLKALAWVRMDQILGPDCLNISAERWTNGLRVEIGFVMSALKWRRRRKKLKNGDLEWRYYPMESEEEEEKEIDPDEIPF